MKIVRRFYLHLVLIVALAGTGFSAEEKAGEKAKPKVNEWAALFLDGKKMGHIHSVRRVSKEGVHTAMDMVMTFKRGDLAMESRTRSQYWETIQGKPLRFRKQNWASGSTMEIKGEIRQGGKLHLTITNGGGKREIVKDWPKGALMAEGSRLRMVKEGLKEGATYSLTSFSEDTLGAILNKIKVGNTENTDLLGKVIPLTCLEHTLVINGAEFGMKVYLDETFEMHKMTMPLMGMEMSMVTCPREVALSKNSPSDFFAAGLLKSPRPLSKGERSGTLVYRISKRKPEPALKFISCYEQSVTPNDDGSFNVEIRVPKLPKGTTFPYAGDDEELVKALKPSLYVQSEEPAVKALARKAIGNSGDGAEAVKAIEAYVRRYIGIKDLSVGYASALEVVKGRQGDCTEHAVLCAALCKAVGIPARVITGFGYLEKGMGISNRFVPHAWTQIWLGGRWYSIDAALGSHDSGHIMLSHGIGDPTDFFGVINVLSNVTINEVSQK